eukprot:scaffold4127_cov126-Cylindrotheca_fusiformis.AAC.8
MRLSFVAFLASLNSQAVRSQSASPLRQGEGNAADPSSSSSSQEQVNTAAQSNGFEYDTSTVSTHRSLAISNWDKEVSFAELAGQTNGGYRLALSGDGTFLAASPREEGTARFFQKKAGTSWTEIETLHLDRVDNKSLGSDVSVSNGGKRLALGSNLYNGTNTFEGKVEIYELDESSGTWINPQVIYGDMYNEQSGYSVALSRDGRTLAIGVPERTWWRSQDPYGAKFPPALGHVRVYRRLFATDDPVQLTGIDGVDKCDFCGGSVALSEDGSVFAFGCPSTCDGTGYVRVFYWVQNEGGDETQGTWKQRGKNIVGWSNTWFGFTIDLSDDGNILAIGGPKGSYAEVYQWKDTNTDTDVWEQLGQTLYRPDAVDFGVTVSLSIRPYSSCVSAILATNDRDTVHTYRLTVGNDQWEELAGVVPGVEMTLSSNSRTLAVVDPAANVYELATGCAIGTNGDPHFRTWNGRHFEYHGQCDMILVKDEDFADGLGLEVQIRTKLVRFWSFIQNAAIRIGDDTLEMQGSPDPFVNKGNNHYWFNSIYQGEVTTLGGFPVKSKYAGKHKDKRWFFSKYGGGNKVSRSFEIDLSSKYPGQKIVLGSYREFVRVDFHNPESDAFGNSVGMLGNFTTGKTFARDGITELNDYTKLGHEWQVLPEEDGMLFHNVSRPQFPEKCIDPEARAMKRRRRRRRRLGESSVTDEQAEVACASIMDVLD